MKVVRILKRVMIVWMIGTLTLPISYFGFNTSLLEAFGMSMGAAGAASLFFIVKSAHAHYRNPYREELAYVRHQVKEARKQLKLIGNYRFKVRSIHMWTKISKLYKVGKSMIEMVEKEPARYKDLQPFFTNYLQATVTVVEKYIFLLSKPIKDIEIKESLHEAERLLHDMSNKYDQLLTTALSEDLLNLDVEMKVLKQHFQEQEYVPVNRTK
ncbi:phosphatase [Priestia megaterium]|nr:phosphatase [Priestia megaterium]